MQTITHPHLQPPLPRMPRMVGWSAAVHAAVVLVLLALDWLAPKPQVFRDVIQVELVPSPQAVTVTEAPKPPPKEAPAPEKPPPLERSPLWDKLESLPPAPPPPQTSSALAEMWDKLSEPTPEPAPQPDLNELRKWVASELSRPLPKPEALTPAEEEELTSLQERWRELNKALPEAARLGEEVPLDAAAQAELTKWFQENVARALAPDRPAAARGSIPQYTELVRRRVDAKFSPPDLFREGKQITAVVRFMIRRDGSTSRLMLARSSGSPYYDQAALRAVMLASPFPPFPEEMKGEHAEFVIRLNLRSRGLGG